MTFKAHWKAHAAFLLALVGFCSIGGREMAPQTLRTPAQNALRARKNERILKKKQKNKQSRKGQSDIEPSSFIIILLYSLFILFLVLCLFY